MSVVLPLIESCHSKNRIIFMSCRSMRWLCSIKICDGKQRKTKSSFSRGNGNQRKKCCIVKKKRTKCCKRSTLEHGRTSTEIQFYLREWFLNLYVHGISNYYVKKQLHANKNEHTPLYGFIWRPPFRSGAGGGRKFFSKENQRLDGHQSSRQRKPSSLFLGIETVLILILEIEIEK